ncbi:hypothetical protein ACIBPB_02735 [Micromonospora sp. NPDC049836]|uniref:hypothetical protein n=1 Tax=Micromonospora sp. NPDC049836 TaxID=3364274 RepID=UPI003789DBB8
MRAAVGIGAGVVGIGGGGVAGGAVGVGDDVAVGDSVGAAVGDGAGEPVGDGELVGFDGRGFGEAPGRPATAGAALVSTIPRTTAPVASNLRLRIRLPLVTTIDAPECRRPARPPM